MNNQLEIGRIKDAYELRKNSSNSWRYSFFNESYLFLAQKREREIFKLLQDFNITSFEDKSILDVGCGVGRELINFIRYGAKPENLFGIDVLQDRIERAKSLSRQVNFECTDASRLSFRDESLDIIIQFTTFTSILDMDMKINIANEMVRVLKPEGLIVWYDLSMNNPRNKNVKGIRRKEIRKLFPGCDVSLKRVTLAPPLARSLVPVSSILCETLEKIPFLCTHYIGAISKRQPS